MTRRNPFEEVERFFERMSEQVETGDWTTWRGGSIPVDVVDADDEFDVIADLPGYEREGIDLTIANGELRITATRGDEHDPDDLRYIRQERPRGRINRTVRFPEPIDEEAAAARHVDGVLRVTLPKASAEHDGTQIDIE